MRMGMALDEAKQILNVDDIRDSEALNKSHEHLFSVNEKAKGGSFYIQGCSCLNKVIIYFGGIFD